MDEPIDQLDFNFAADDLLEFPRDLGEEGYFQFNSERKQAVQALAVRFGVPINQRVCLRLFGIDKEFEGKMVLDSLLLPPLTAEIIRLRVGKVSFEHSDIAYCRTLD